MTYGCYNRPPLGSPLIVQYGWTRTYWNLERFAIFREIPYRMSLECQYSKDSTDPQCAGCIHNQQEMKVENHNQADPGDVRG